METNPSSKWCSLVPMGTACRVTTTGFRWNLNNQILSFGSLISTSNEFDKNERLCRIETDRPLLFSMDTSKSNQFWLKSELIFENFSHFLCSEIITHFIVKWVFGTDSDPSNGKPLNASPNDWVKRHLLFNGHSFEMWFSFIFWSQIVFYLISFGFN